MALNDFKRPSITASDGESLAVWDSGGSEIPIVPEEQPAKVAQLIKSHAGFRAEV